MQDGIVVYVHIPGRREAEELEIPGSISAMDLIAALYQIYGIQWDANRQFDYYIQMDSPKALLRGHQILRDMGMRDGSELWLPG